MRAGRERWTLVMLQLHQALSPRLEVQAGLGGRRETGDAWRPRTGIRLVRSL